MQNRFPGSLENIFPLTEKKVHSTFQEYLNHRIAALAGTSENHSTATSYTNNKKMEVPRGRVACPDIFYWTQIRLVLPKVRPDYAA